MARSARTVPRRGPDFYAGDDYVIDESYGFLVRRLHASLQRHIERRMQPHDLTAMQWAPLLLLAEGKADTGAELARWMTIDTGAMTRMLDRLEAKGLLERRRCEADRRVVRLRLTAEGEAAVARVPTILAEVLNLHLAGFDAAELSSLMGYLRRMIDNGTRDEPT
ncbi:MAG: MarR family winged helix-turn-helix transcriptional regulator [Gammaproteobacteria bacterium]